MMNKKRTIATLASMIIGINTIPITSVNAKVIEPEIVKTETWTTSYYIDDDMETLYPYIDCQADIYNDGTMRVYYWNTHEWEGYTSKVQKATIINSRPYNDIDSTYALNYVYYNNSKHYGCPFTVSYYPIEYTYDALDKDTMFDKWYPQIYAYSATYKKSMNESGYQYQGALSMLSTQECSQMYFKPIVEPCETYEFYVLGHYITITPDLLSQETITSKTDTTNLELNLQKLKENYNKLIEENAKLKEENNNLQRVLSSYGNRAYGDMNNDGITDARDASILLTYYAKTSVGYTGTLDDFIREQNGG